MRLIVLALLGIAWPAGLVVAAEPTACAVAEPDCLAFPRAETVLDSFLHLQMALGALQERVQFDPQISSASVTAIGAQMNELQAMFISPGGGETQPAYVEDLDATATAIMTVVGEDNAADANNLLDLIQRDFQVKLATARSTMGAQGGKPRTIPVTITPRRGTQGVSGLRVKLGKGLRPTVAPTIVFGQLSGPATSGDVTPGIYLVYAYQLDPQRGEVVAGKEMLVIGLQGQSSAKLDLRVN